jgi:hypothetical protein
VKWILIISIWRFCCGPFKYDFNADDYLENINNNGFVSYLKLNYLSYGVIVIFIYLFYKTTSAFQR